MKKILLVFIILALVGTTSIFAFVFFKKHSNDRILAGRDEDIEKLRCPDCNVILIGVDALRADHLSSYGYFRDTSTNIDKFAEKGVLFRNTFSAASKTTSSFMSIFTSLYPTDHGVLTTLASDKQDRQMVAINDEIMTLPQVLKGHGYKTYAMATSPQLAPELGFDRGFDEFEIGTMDKKRVDLLALLPQLKAEKFFIFFHDIEPHDPYIPPFPYYSYYDPSPFGKSLVENFYANASDIGRLDIRDSDSLYVKSEKMRKYWEGYSGLFWSEVDVNNPLHISDLISLYDGEIKHLDEFIGRLQGVLEENNLLGNTIIIFTADHGEEFYEHGKFTHRQLYNELLHVPLILKWPKIDRKIDVNQTVRTVDIMPTLLDILEIKISDPLRGISLLSLVIDQSKQFDLPVVSQQSSTNSLIKDSYKIIINNSSSKLYNLTDDPLEKNNLAELNREKLEELKNALDSTLSDERFVYPPVPISIDINENKRENLRSLGY